MTNDEKVDKIYRLLLGNGSVGLCEQVRDNAQSIGQLSKTMIEHIEEEKKKPFKTKEWLLFAIVIMSFIISILLKTGVF